MRSKSVRERTADSQDIGDITAEEAIFLEEAIVEADQDPDPGISWEEFRDQLRG